MTAIHCPCCGQPCPDLPRLDSLVVACALTGDVKRLFMILSAARGRFLNKKEIADILWSDRLDGGPDFSDRSIYVLAWRLRAALAAYPIDLKFKGFNPTHIRIQRRWTIHNNYNGWILEPEEHDA